MVLEFWCINQEINQLNIEFRLELLKCHFAANTQQGRLINWDRVLQISKEILAIDEFNLNACVSLSLKTLRDNGKHT